MKHRIFPLLAVIIVIQLNAQKFEEGKINPGKFEKLSVNVGADFAIQYQGLNHRADSLLIPLGKNVNLPTANLNLSADLAPGIKLNVITYLSSRHHPDAWVKGGHLLIDHLPFIKSDLAEKVMDVITLKMGVMELNYGDAHFRRSDNGNVIDNPFVGNYTMDAFTTAPALEALLRTKGLILMGGVTTGSLRPDLAGYSSFSNSYTAYNMIDELGFYSKLGYDRQLTEDFRLRATASGYYCGNHHFGSLYYGDRAGSRYYLVMNLQTGSPDDVSISDNHTSGRWGPGFTDENRALMLNLFTKYKGLEFFGTFEKTSGTGAFSDSGFDFTQFAFDLLYRFGRNEKFYGGFRFNAVSNGRDQDLSRIQAGAGWFMTENIILKAEYVDQNFNNFAEYGQDAGFNGLMVEAAVSFQ